MRHFSYFLFENFDADAEAQNPCNPRRFLGTDTDSVLSFLADFPVGGCSYARCAQLFGTDVLNHLIDGGVLRRQADALLFDCPIFLQEDATRLQSGIASAAHRLADQLEQALPEIRALCGRIQNGFSVETNLYHILCGMVFDGSFFDYLDLHHGVSTARLHPSGLDYLIVIYEKCPELDDFANHLLCSYNRFADEKCALQSFGDANGNRFDFYRFSRLLENGKFPAQFQSARQLLGDSGLDKQFLLDQVTWLITEGDCAPSAMALLEHFSYARNGKICVPVYTNTDAGQIAQISRAVEACLGTAFLSALAALSSQLHITATRHGAASGEFANELYHILFGSVNQELAARGIVASPPDIPGEGRYLKCIQAISSS